MPKAPPSDGDGCNGQIDPTIDLEINGGDHVAVKAPQLFAVANAMSSMSTVTLLMSSMSDAADVSNAWNLTPSHAEPNIVGTI